MPSATLPTSVRSLREPKNLRNSAQTYRVRQQRTPDALNRMWFQNNIAPHLPHALRVLDGRHDTAPAA